MGFANKIISIINRIVWQLKSKRLMHCGQGGVSKQGPVLVSPECIRIGDRFIGGRNLKLQAWLMFSGNNTMFTPELVIGNNVSIMDNCQISCLKSVKIGDNCLFGENVFITDNFHGNSDFDDMLLPPTKRNLAFKGEVNIGSNVWIGRNVCIMPGVQIGDGAIIGANAVVTEDIPSYCVAAGVPAKIIKKCRRE